MIMENIMGILACILTAFRQLRAFRIESKIEFDSASISNSYFRDMVDTIICKLQEKDFDVAAFVHAMRKVQIWQHRGVIVIDISAADPACHELLLKTFIPIMEANNSIFVYTITTAHLSIRGLERYIRLLDFEDPASCRIDRQPRQHEQHMVSAG